MTVYYDPTAGWLDTPGGLGKFVYYDSTTGTVYVEMDCSYIVAYPAEQCFILRLGGAL